MNLEAKLTILADAAKYDVSCASSGSRRKNTGRRLGNAAPCGICHSFTEDGRCVSLLKILFTNFCIYDCAYCINRCGNDIPRAAFTPAEVVALTIDFYRRNYIEGLFFSSGVLRSPDDTLERLVRTVKDIRRQGFNGYIHLKCVPFASPETDYEILQLSDRLYRQQALKRVYYSAYVPLAQAGPQVPAVERPPLRRENRLSQADWLLRRYGFELGEIIGRDAPHLDLEMDPKRAFALRTFPGGRKRGRP